jgi:hypothetical protein
MRWAGHVARIGEKIEVYRVLVGNPEGKRALGTPRHRLDCGIEADFQEIDREGVEWIQLAEDRDSLQALANMILNLCVLAPQSYLVVVVLTMVCSCDYICCPFVMVKIGIGERQ